MATLTFPQDCEESTCVRCGRRVIWELDRDPMPDDFNESVPSPHGYGFWYDIETGTESCTPGPNDEDYYHEGAAP